MRRPYFGHSLVACGPPHLVMVCATSVGNRLHINTVLSNYMLLGLCVVSIVSSSQATLFSSSFFLVYLLWVSLETRGGVPLLTPGECRWRHPRYALKWKTSGRRWMASSRAQDPGSSWP